MAPSRFLVVLLSALFISAAAGSVRAQESEKTPVSLGRYIPASVHSYGRWRLTPAEKRLLAPFGRAVKKLVDSGIGADLFDLATLELSDEKRTEVRAVTERILRLLGTPSWGALVEHEVALGARVALPPEYVVLFRVPESEVANRRAELKKLFEGVREFAPDALAVDDSERLGAGVTSLAFTGAPFALSVGAKRDVIAIATSNVFLDETLALMDVEDGAGSIVRDPRFLAAVEGLGPRDGFESFVDIKGYMEFVRQMLDIAGTQIHGDPDAAGALSILGTIFEALGKVDAVAGVQRAEGNRWITETRVSFSKEGEGPTYIEKLVAAQKPFTDVWRVIPVDASSFFMTNGLPPAKLYDDLAALVRKRLPRGEEILGQWEAIQKRIGFHLRDDLLSWIEGGCGMIAMPRKPTGTDCVSFLRVTDREKAQGFVKGVVEKLKGFLESRGQSLAVEEVEGLGPEFRSLRLAALPSCRPVIGFPGEDTFVLASSPDAVRRVRETFSGDAPSFRENPRFEALGVPDGPLCELYFHDVENSLEWLADILGGVGLVASVLPMDRETKPAIKLGPIITKLSMFLRDVDLSLDYGGWTRYDAETHTLRMRQVVTQRAP
jgi:hypothetical protein